MVGVGGGGGRGVVGGYSCVCVGGGRPWVGGSVWWVVWGPLLAAEGGGCWSGLTLGEGMAARWGSGWLGLVCGGCLEWGGDAAGLGPGVYRYRGGGVGLPLWVGGL